MGRFLCNLAVLFLSQIVFIFSVFAIPAERIPPAASSSEEIYYEELKKEYIPQKDPEASFQLELKLMTDGMYCYDLPLFDPGWRQKGKRILTSPLFQKTAQIYQESFKVYSEESYAVIYFPGRKTLGPIFLYKEQDGWIIDRSAIADKVIYERNGHWMAAGGDYPYFDLLQKVYSLEKIPVPERGFTGYRPRDEDK